jgi:hypothetical protein
MIPQEAIERAIRVLRAIGRVVIVGVGVFTFFNGLYGGTITQTSDATTFIGGLIVVAVIL